MAFRNILTWPDPSLREVSEPVTAFDENLKSLVHDLNDTLNVATGVGLAASQVGVHQRCVIIDTAQCGLENPTPTEGLPANILVLVNPALELSGPKHKWVEACLSVPDSRGMVERHQAVTVKYNSVSGTEHTLTLGWPAAGVMQHECDHLDGVLYVDRMSSLAREMILSKITKKRKKLADARELMLSIEDDNMTGSSGLTRKNVVKRKVSASKRNKQAAKKNRLNRGRKK